MRYELVNEFLRETGRSFTILDFSEFLRLNGAKDKAVEEAKAAEEEVRDVQSEYTKAIRAAIAAGVGVAMPSEPPYIDGDLASYERQLVAALARTDDAVRDLRQTLVAAFGSKNPLLFEKLRVQMDECSVALNLLLRFKPPDMRGLNHLLRCVSTLSEAREVLSVGYDDELARTHLRQVHDALGELQYLLAQYWQKYRP